MTESELVERCRNADREAQRELYDRTSDRIYRLLHRMTGNEDAAFDLAQDTYLRAFTRISQFNGESTLATWLYRIAVNEALQYMRRKELTHRNGDGDPASCRSSPMIDRAIAALDVGDALNRLDPADRVVLLLRYQEGLDYGAIAQAMGCPVGTVASRLNRARNRVQELLAGGYGSAEEKGRDRHLIEQRADENTARMPEDPPRAEAGFP